MKTRTPATYPTAGVASAARTYIPNISPAIKGRANTVQNNVCDTTVAPLNPVAMTIFQLLITLTMRAATAAVQTVSQPTANSASGDRAFVKMATPNRTAEKTIPGMKYFRFVTKYRTSKSLLRELLICLMASENTW